MLTAAHRSRYGGGPSPAMHEHVSAANTNFRVDYDSYLDRLTPQERRKMTRDPTLAKPGADAPHRSTDGGAGAPRSKQSIRKSIQTYNRHLMFGHSSNVLLDQRKSLRPELRAMDLLGGQVSMEYKARHPEAGCAGDLLESSAKVAISMRGAAGRGRIRLLSRAMPARAKSHFEYQMPVGLHDLVGSLPPDSNKKSSGQRKDD